MKLKTIDLCAGIGGIRRGFELAGGYRNIASAEIDEMACKTYEHLFHEDPRNDVTNEKFKKHLQTLHYDVLMAGFPCQAFSSVGLQHGFEDKTKGTIFFDIAKIIKMTRPKVVFLENVQNLLSHDKQATFKTMDLPDDIKDKFWTLTVYFNSLKDLGKCSTLVDDDVKDFIKRTAYRLGSAKDARMIARADELTSRVNTTQLNETLDKLEKLCYSKENIENKRYPSNILLATNMISVGIDVARLNVMLLVGQPKLTSEYIQASSRVGRSFPGVAFALYDGSKSRDRSHYEQFKPYHESFYKHVEPTGATPFSKPARDRALHAVIIAMVRVLEDELSAEKGAAKFNRKDYAARIAELKKYITERASDISKRMNTEMVDDSSEIALEIDSVFEKWEQLAENFDEEHFYYGEKFLIKEPDDGEGRLMKPFNTSRNDPAFDTMTSMRNVDSTVAGNVLIWEEV